MTSVMKKLRNKRSKGDEFQITASAASLVLECQKEKWHPRKLAIVWNKETPKLSSTKPVPWQGGFKNPYRGTIVWPEPDPVKTKLTLFKNSEKELYQYQDKPWKILVQNVTPSGRTKVIAVGSLDISDYVQEEPTSCDVTVTLKPVKKCVLSGSLEFTLSSVLLEDGVPRRTDKEIFDEIMNDARTELERRKSLQKARKSNGQGSKRSSQTSGHKVPVSDTAACDSQEAASCRHSNIAGQRKVDSKAPFNSPPLHAASQSASPEPRPSQLPRSSQLNCEVNKMKSSLSQSEEKTSNKKAAKYPKEFDAFGEKEPDDRQSSVSSANASDLCKEITVKDAEGSDRECRNENLDQADENNNLTKNGDAKIAKNDSRDDDHQHQSEDVLPISQQCPELFVYIREETSLLQDEIASLEKVSTQLEKEIQGVNKTKGCEEELEGLTQDLVSLNKCRVELIRRKQDLEILGREENLEECVSGIRQELVFLFELEGWRKTDQHKACEQKLIDALVSLARLKKIEIYNCPTGLKF